MTKQRPKLLEVSKITYHFEGIPLLQEVSFGLEKGEILCLLGPSGSGKTTLLRLLAGLEKADSGTVYFKGRDVQPIPPHKRNFGMMFQEYALFPHKSVFGNISFGLEMLQVPPHQRDKTVQKMLELVGLSGFERRKIDDLSGGERQRIALARSLAPEPQLLLLDEPLGSLDRTLRDRLAVEIRSILKTLGVTAVFVTHDQAEAFSVADKVAILDKGLLHQFDTPENLYRFPKNTNVAHFLGFTNLITQRDDLEQPLQNLFDTFSQQKVRARSTVSSTLLIRPDGARLHSDNCCPADCPILTGVVLHQRFQGNSYRITVKIAGVPLTFDLPIDPQPPLAGQMIELAVIPSALVLIDPPPGQ
jgi:ABC-type Fe3+/spermidine/putrescine transport system ATPase subunit